MKFLSTLAQIVFSLFSYASIEAWAGFKAPDPILTAKAAGPNLILEATPPSGHHFNREAPKFVTLGQSKLNPTFGTERLLRYELPIGAEGNFNFEVFLCDEAKTFCERHVLHGAWKAGLLSVSKPNRRSQ